MDENTILAERVHGYKVGGRYTSGGVWIVGHKGYDYNPRTNDEQAVKALEAWVMSAGGNNVEHHIYTYKGEIRHSVTLKAKSQTVPLSLDRFRICNKSLASAIVDALLLALGVELDENGDIVSVPSESGQ